MDFRVMSDSSCDISLEQEKAYDIRLVSAHMVGEIGIVDLRKFHPVTAAEFADDLTLFVSA